jgi:hemoglobin
MIATSTHAETARLTKRKAAEAIGIDPGFIARLVERFYAKVRADDRLGPIFAARVGDWTPHLDRMTAFWGSVLHQSGGFSGNPMLKHIAIPDIGRPDFDRWLRLFEATLDEIEIDPRATALIAAKARTIGESLLLGIQIHRDGRSAPHLLKGADHA